MMNALIVEDDILVAELLNSLVCGLRADAQVTLVGDLDAARRAWHATPYDLLICDWDLPDGKGLDLVRQIRQTAPDLPMLMISAQTDRRSVMLAARYRVNGFVTKPVDVAAVRTRLQQILPVSSAAQIPYANFDARLRRAAEGPLHLPFAINPAVIIGLIERGTHLSASELVSIWQAKPALTARLLEVANSSSFQRSGKACYVLRDAVNTLGIPMSLNQALALALDMTHALADTRLQTLAAEYSAVSLAVARVGQKLASRIGTDPMRAYTAGLLHRLGELIVLDIGQQHLTAGGTLADGELASGLSNWAATFGNKLKSQWGLPLELRELIGATHRLMRGPEPQGRQMMRAAALIAQEQAGSEECRKLLRLIGFHESVAEWSAEAVGE